MANTSAATGLTVQQWDSQFFMEYIRENRFKSVMGTDENSIIQVREDLSKKPGDSITFALVNKLTNAAVTGTNTLEGNEEDLASRSFRLYVDKLRNAVRIPEMAEVKSAIDLRKAARAALKDWIMEETRDDIITALGAINGVAYASASEAQKDAWLVDNADRVLFGAAKSNNSANDHSASLANIDDTADKLSPATISLMRRIALTASPKVRPIRVDGDRQYFILYVNSLSMRDLRVDTTMVAANRDAMQRGKDNPLFSSGDLLWEDVVVKEIEDIGVLAGVGAAGIQVGPAYLCGAQAVGMAWAKRSTTKTQEFDYGDKYGVAMEEIRGIKKILFGSGSGDTDDLKDNGVVTGFFAAVADA